MLPLIFKKVIEVEICIVFSNWPDDDVAKKFCVRETEKLDKWEGKWKCECQKFGKKSQYIFSTQIR